MLASLVLILLIDDLLELILLFLEDVHSEATPAEHVLGELDGFGVGLPAVPRADRPTKHIIEFARVSHPVLEVLELLQVWVYLVVATDIGDRLALFEHLGSACHGLLTTAMFITVKTLATGQIKQT